MPRACLHISRIPARIFYDDACFLIYEVSTDWDRYGAQKEEQI